MASGKSAVGKNLARRLGLKYLDIDETIEKDTGLPIAKIFEKKGESAFRDLESKELRACSRESFVDDPLRIFRAFRFQTQGWRMVPETEALIRAKSWEKELSGIPVERFSREMLKALKGNCPAEFYRLYTISVILWTVLSEMRLPTAAM